jgi:hypothetical protein
MSTADIQFANSHTPSWSAMIRTARSGLAVQIEDKSG